MVCPLAHSLLVKKKYRDVLLQKALIQERLMKMDLAFESISSQTTVSVGTNEFYQ